MVLISKNSKYTATLSNSEEKIVKTIKAVKDFSNIDETISFIVQDYGKQKGYSKFIKKYGKKKEEGKK